MPLQQSGRWNQSESAVRGVPDEADGHRLRAEAAYSDPSYAERACDGCGRLYRGPAVYCCLRCALSDA